MGQERKEGGDGELVEVGEGVSLPFPAQGFGLEALAAAGGARVVGTVAREEDAHVHLVGVFLEPAEEALHAIPILRPGLAVFFAVTGFAVDDEVALLGREGGEGDVGRDLLFLGENVEVFFRFAVDVAFPGLDRSLVDRQRLVGNGEAVVDFDDAAKPSALGAGTEGRIEREESGGGGAESAARFRGVEAAGEVADFGDRISEIGVRGGEEKDLALAEVEGGFDGFEEAGFVGGRDDSAVLDDVEGVCG